jgi:hypothetical protein
MCGADCGHKHQVMLDTMGTIAKLEFKLNESNELLDMYRTLALTQEREIELMLNEKVVLDQHLAKIREMFITSMSK